MTTTTATLDAARNLGAEQGRADATWVFDGNTDESVYRLCLSLDDDGDPAWHDIFGPRTGPLSGEMADGRTPFSLLEELGWTDDDIDTHDYALQDEVCQTFEEAYYAAYEEAVLDTARLHLA